MRYGRCNPVHRGDISNRLTRKLRTVGLVAGHWSDDNTVSHLLSLSAFTSVLLILVAVFHVLPQASRKLQRSLTFNSHHHTFNLTCTNVVSSSNAMATTQNSDADALIKSDDPKHPANLICSLCRQFYTFGWVTGTGGGISIRNGHHVFLAPSGVEKELMQPENIFVMNYASREYIRRPLVGSTYIRKIL